MGQQWESNFDSNVEGWEIYLGASYTFLPPNYNPEGYICFSSEGIVTEGNWLFMKLDWLDWSALYGGIISFDIKVSGPGAYYNTWNSVYLELPGEEGSFLYADIEIKPPKDVWTTFTVRISDDLFIKYEDPTTDLSELLGEISGMGIRGNLLNGSETVCIDNVKVFRSGQANLANIIQALQIIAGLNPKSALPISDIDGDEKIGLAEAIHHLQELSDMR